MPRESLLMVLYYFPPCGSSGVLRSVRFVRGLKSAGWRPVVLTVAERDIAQLAYGTVPYDDSNRDVEEGIRILRARAVRPSQIAIAIMKGCGRIAVGVAGAARRAASLPNRRASERAGERPTESSGSETPPRAKNVKSYYSVETGPLMKFVFDLVLIVDTLFEWAPGAIALALRRLDRSGISHIYSSSPPISAHFVALWLKILWRKRWVMDLRDPLFDTADSEGAGRRSAGLIRAYYRLIERILVRKADVVICNCEEIRAYYRSRHPRTRFEVITNSYDSADASRRAQAVREGSDGASRYVIGHFGLLYPTVRTPDAFLRGLSAAIRERPALADALRVDFVGDRKYTSSISFLDILRELNLEAIVTCGGYVPHDEIMSRMAASDLLLLLQPHASTRYQIPAKLFEYLAARRPILAVAPEGSATRGIIRRYGLGFVRDPSDLEGIARDIIGAFDGAAPMAGEETLRTFSSEATTKQLTMIADSLS